MKSAKKRKCKHPRRNLKDVVKPKGSRGLSEEDYNDKKVRTTEIQWRQQ